MPKAIGEFINDLAQKAGVASDNTHLKALLAAPELMNVKVDDELITSLDSGLISLSEAKNNHPDIKSKYFADAFDGVDKKFMSMLSEEDFSSEDLSEIRNEKSTIKKIELGLSKLKAAKAKATPADKAEINKQLADLNEALRVEKEGKTKLVEEYEGKIKNIHLESALTNQFAPFKTIYDELPVDVKNTTLRALINKALQDNNAELTVDDKGTLQLVKKDGTNVFGSDNRQLTPQSFFDKTFAPILKVSTPKNTQTTQQIPAPVQNGNATSDFIQSHNQKVLEGLPS